MLHASSADVDAYNSLDVGCTSADTRGSLATRTSWAATLRDFVMQVLTMTLAAKILCLATTLLFTKSTSKQHIMNLAVALCFCTGHPHMSLLLAPNGVPTYGLRHITLHAPPNKE
jgi:hypothetical protein